MSDFEFPKVIALKHTPNRLKLGAALKTTRMTSIFWLIVLSCRLYGYVVCKLMSLCYYCRFNYFVVIFERLCLEMLLCLEQNTMMPLVFCTYWHFIQSYSLCDTYLQIWQKLFHFTPTLTPSKIWIEFDDITSLLLLVITFTLLTMMWKFNEKFKLC